MNHIKIISIENNEQWDGIIKSFKNYDIYYLADYTKAFQIHGDGEPCLIYYNGDSFRAANVVMKRDISMDKNFVGLIPADKYFDLSTPYGYGGFLLEDNVNEDNIKALNNEYIEFCTSMGFISEFVRFHPVLKNSNELNKVYEIINLGKTITIELDSTNKIWDNLTSKNRNMVRKAKKSGVEIYWGRSPELFDEFVQMYNATMDKDNASEYYYFNDDFYNSIINDLKYNSLMFYAMYQKKIIAMSIIIFANHKMHYHLSASIREYQYLAPTNLLLYEAACWGSINGYSTFHLGGGLGSKEDSLYKFKKAFNRQADNSYLIGKKIFNNSVYDKLVSIRAKELSYNSNSTFFPIYRA